MQDYLEDGVETEHDIEETHAKAENMRIKNIKLKDVAVVIFN